MEKRLKKYLITFLSGTKIGFIKPLFSNIIIKRFASIFSVDILVRGSSFIFLPIYLSLMTKEEYGLFGYLISIVGSFALVMNFGLYVPQIKMFHDFQDDKERGAALFTMNISLLILLITMLGIIYWFDLDLVAVQFLFKNNIDYLNYRAYVLCTVFVSVFGLMLYSYFMTSEKIGHIQSYNVAKLIAGNLIVITALYILTEKDSVLTRLQYALFAETLVLFSFGYLFLRKMVPVFRFDIFLKAFKLGLPVMLTAILSIFSLSDRFFLEKYYDFETMAIYNLALAFCSIIPIIMTSFQAVYGPIFFKEKDLQVNLRRTNKIAIIMTGVFLLIGVGIVTMTQILIYVGIIKSSYSQVVFLLPIMLIGSIMMALSQLYQNFMVYFEVTHIMPVFFIITNAVCILLSMFLVPKFGIYGAAWAVAISGTSTLMIHCIFVVKRKQLLDRLRL